jgi:glycosyltransferase involved in cell wall biosynthesis
VIQAPWSDAAPQPVGTEPELATGISVVVPVYRSAETLRELVRRLTETVGGLGEPYEIILVEDASPDGSWSVISDLARDDQRVRGVQLSRNYGQHNAILCGIRAARFDRTVTLDDDLQNPPEEIPTPRPSRCKHGRRVRDPVGRAARVPSKPRVEVHQARVAGSDGSRSARNVERVPSVPDSTA